MSGQTANRLNIYRYAALALVAAGALHLLSTLVTTGLEFDESFNLQVPLNLYHFGKYQTWYNGFHAFNYLITTGPAQLVPMYLAFLVSSSTSFIAARLVTAAFTLLFLGLIFNEFFGKDMTARSAVYGGALFVLLFSVPEFFTLGVRALGELPGITLVFASYALFSRAERGKARGFWAGAALALAVLTKMIFLMAVVPVAVALIDEGVRGGGIGRAVKRAVRFAAGFVLPLALWHLYKLYSLGVDGYIEAWRLQRKFVAAMTAGRSGVFVDRAMHVAGTRIDKLLADVGMSGAAGYLFLAIVAISTVLFLYVYLRDRGIDRLPLLVLMFGMVHTGWWLTLDIVDYYRHLFPGLVMLLVGLALCASGMNPSTNRLDKPAALLFAAVFVMFIGANTGGLYWIMDDGFGFEPSRELSEQEAYAGKVAELSKKGYVFYAYEWLQVPELSFLSGVRFYSAYDNRSLSYLAKRPGVLIVSRYNYYKNRKMSMDTLANFTDVDESGLAEAGFPEDTPYVLAPVTKVGGRRIVPVGR